MLSFRNIEKGRTHANKKQDKALFQLKMENTILKKELDVYKIENGDLRRQLEECKKAMARLNFHKSYQFH